VTLAIKERVPTETPAIARTPAPARPRIQDSATTRVQRTAGNLAIQRFAAGQALRISQPTDAAELEADRVADQVMRMTANGGGSPLHVWGAASPAIHRCSNGEMCGPCARGECHTSDASVQRQATGSHVEAAPADVAPAGAGQPLSASVRAPFEAAFGHDFSHVRIRTDSPAQHSAADLASLAYTVGNSISFAAGQYAPSTLAGQRLLAHELTHVVQQGAAGPAVQRAERLTPVQSLTGGAYGPAAPLTIQSCIATSDTNNVLTSNESFDVYYEKDNSNPGEISLRRRSTNSILHAIGITAMPRTGSVTFPANIQIPSENDRYLLEMKYLSNSGAQYGGLGSRRPAIRFETCRLSAKPRGDLLLLAKVIYAEGSDKGEYEWVRDVVYNRIAWTTNHCSRDARSLGTDIRSVLNAPNQFASVLSNTPKFQELESQLDSSSGPCQYTTSPRASSPATCRLINDALSVVAAGNGHSHSYIFFRSDNHRPSTRAVNMGQYPGGNFYWEISGCS
jgi:hypothetical protein